MKEKLLIPKSIFILVIGLHALLCCYLFLKTPSLKTLPPKLTPIQTRLVMIETPKVNPKKTDGANTLVKKESQLSSLPKKEPPKSKVPQKETPKSKPPQKEEIAKKREQLQIVLPKKEEVAKEIKTQNEIILPKAVGTLAIESTEKTTNPATPSSLTGAFAQKEYQNELTRFVRAHVKMPREGKVLLEVTISREGKILDIKVKDSTDAGILHTIKEKVAKLNLPPFSHELLGQKEQTYLLELY